jgi:hypothetical protein
MHHADLEFDVTMGVRFHSIEIVVSMLTKFAVVVALGAPALAVFIYEVLLSATSMFNHGNVRLPGWADCICAGWWSRRRCTESTTQSCGMRPTATTVSTYPGGIGCSAPIAPSRRPGTRHDDRHQSVPGPCRTTFGSHAAATVAQRRALARSPGPHYSFSPSRFRSRLTTGARSGCAASRNTASRTSNWKRFADVNRCMFRRAIRWAASAQGRSRAS